MLVIKMKMIMELGDYKKGTKDCMTVTPPAGTPLLTFGGSAFTFAFPAMEILIPSFWAGDVIML